MSTARDSFQSDPRYKSLSNHLPAVTPSGHAAFQPVLVDPSLSNPVHDSGTSLTPSLVQKTAVSHDSLPESSSLPPLTTDISLSRAITRPLPRRNQYHEGYSHHRTHTDLQGAAADMSKPVDIAHEMEKPLERDSSNEEGGRRENNLRLASNSPRTALRDAPTEVKTRRALPDRRKRPRVRSQAINVFRVGTSMRDRSALGASPARQSSGDDKMGRSKDIQTRENTEDDQHEISAITPANKRKKGNPESLTPLPRVTKMNQRPGRQFEMQWRVGQAPAVAMRQTKEQTNYELILSATSRYYRGNAESMWKTSLQQGAGDFNGKMLTESFAVSVMTAAGLITAGQPDHASLILGKVLPLAKTMLLQQHPQLYFFLNEMCMDTSQTVVGNLRAAIKGYLSPIAADSLGKEHPVSILLGTPLTVEQRVRLRSQGQVVAHEEHIKAFGTYSYQSMIHLWYWARLTAASGHMEESLRMLERLTETWERVYSANSAVAITAICEQARVMLASGEAGVKVECLLGDALRRNDVLSSGQGLQVRFIDAAEERLRESGLVFSRLAALRELGRMHVMRKNFGAAVHSLEQAVAIAEERLQPEASVRQLCVADLNAARMLEVDQAASSMSIEDPTSSLPPISSIVPFVPIET